MAFEEGVTDQDFPIMKWCRNEGFRLTLGIDVREAKLNYAKAVRLDI